MVVREFVSVERDFEKGEVRVVSLTAKTMEEAYEQREIMTGNSDTQFWIFSLDGFKDFWKVVFKAQMKFKEEGKL